MLASCVQLGFFTWAFYAAQPYLLDLLESDAVWVAGLVAAGIALSTIAGNQLVEVLSRRCGRRTTLLLGAAAVETCAAVALGLVSSFWLALPALLLVTAASGVDEPGQAGVPPPGGAERAARDRRLVRLDGLEHRRDRRPARARRAGREPLDRLRVRRGRARDRARAAAPRARACDRRGAGQDRRRERPGWRARAPARGCPTSVAVETDAYARARPARGAASSCSNSDRRRSVTIYRDSTDGKETHDGTCHHRRRCHRDDRIRFMTGRHGRRRGRPFGPGHAFGRRAGRGDIRAAILALLAEEPMHGYQIIQELAERTGGVWRPSPGSVYPTLQQLEDEELVRETAVRVRQARLRAHRRRPGAGRRAPAPLDRGRRRERERARALRDLAHQVLAATRQVAHAGTAAQIEAAQAVLRDARRALYRLLAEDDDATTRKGRGSRRLPRPLPVLSRSRASRGRRRPGRPPPGSRSSRS